MSGIKSNKIIPKNICAEPPLDRFFGDEDYFYPTKESFEALRGKFTFLDEHGRPVDRFGDRLRRAVPEPPTYSELEAYYKAMETFFRNGGGPKSAEGKRLLLEQQRLGLDIGRSYDVESRIKAMKESKLLTQSFR